VPPPSIIVEMAESFSLYIPEPIDQETLTHENSILHGARRNND
jgi:hypothetical protein